MFFYDANTDRILSSSGIPDSLTLADGTALFGSSGLFNIINSGIDVFASAGYYTINSGISQPPSGQIEDIDARVISYSGSYVNITQTFIPIVEEVPPVITQRQMRLWLYDNGTTASGIEVLLNNISGVDTREKALIEWEYANEIERFHPLVLEIGSGLGLTSGDLNTAFIEAAKL